LHSRLLVAACHANGGSLAHRMQPIAGAARICFSSSVSRGELHTYIKRTMAAEEARLHEANKLKE